MSSDAFLLWLQCSTMHRPSESRKPLPCLLPPKYLCVAGFLSNSNASRCVTFPCQGYPKHACKASKGVLGPFGRVPNLALRAAPPRVAAAFAVYQLRQELMHVHSKAVVLQQPLLVQFVVGQSVMSDLGVMTLLVGCLCLLPVRLCLMLRLSVVTKSANPAGLHRNGGEGSFLLGGVGGKTRLSHEHWKSTTSTFPT